MQHDVHMIDDTIEHGEAGNGGTVLTHLWRERALSAENIVHGRDELGRTGWFVRVEITGLFPRRCGPFESHADAVSMLEEILGAIVPGVLCQVEADLGNRCVIEEIPRLAPRPPELSAVTGAV